MPHYSQVQVHTLLVANSRRMSSTRNGFRLRRGDYSTTGLMAWKCLLFGTRVRGGLGTCDEKWSYWGKKHASASCDRHRPKITMDGNGRYLTMYVLFSFGITFPKTMPTGRMQIQ